MAELEPAPLTVEVEQPGGDNVVIKVAGELDGSNVERLRTAVEAQLEGKPSTFSFDLADVSFMDTSGLATLIAARRAVDDVRILNPSPQVRSVIDRTGLAGILVMEP
jgi:anti-sigma B factor antagonist